MGGLFVVEVMSYAFAWSVLAMESGNNVIKE